MNSDDSVCGRGGGPPTRPASESEFAVVSTADELSKQIESGNACFCVLHDEPRRRLVAIAARAVCGSLVLIDSWSDMWLEFDSPIVKRWEVHRAKYPGELRPIIEPVD